MVPKATSGRRGTMDAPPLRLEPAAAFAAVERALHAARFDEATICEALGVETMAEAAGVAHAELSGKVFPTPGLGLLLRLLLYGDALPETEVGRALDRPTLDALLTLDLLRAGDGAPAARAPSGPPAYYSPVKLYPVAGFLIASDRDGNPDGSPFVAPPDVVFPAIFQGTLRFLRVLPRSPARDALDLCAGSGIGALVLSSAAERVVSADITARCSHFARFNCLLNGRTNVEVAQGDLYQAVAGRTFDQIVAHPPYVPSASDSAVFRDAGETGEAVLQRIVAGLPQSLRPGGTFSAVCAAWDAKGLSFEARLRQWLAGAEEEFDILFALHHDTSVEAAAQELAQRTGGDALAQLRHWREVWSEAGLERAVYGALFVARRGSGGTGVPRGAPITRRLRLGARTGGAAFEWLLRWLRWRATREARGEFVPAMLGLAPRLAPHLRVNVAHVPGAQGGLVVSDVVLETEEPFLAQTRIDPWMLPLIARFEGKETAGAIYEDARAAGALPQAFSEQDLAALVALLIERGYGEAPGLTLEG